MGITELVLLIFGGVVFTVSFFLPSGQGKEEEGISQVNEEQIKEIIDREVSEAKTQIHDIVDETITYSMEKTERSMERLSNEKIMAVNEYSDTVLEQINKNHNEVVFLYDMLNDKHENLKNMVSEVTKTASEVKQAVKDAEITAREVKARAQEAKDVQESLSIRAALPQKAEMNAVETASAAGLEVTSKVSAAEKEFVPILPERVKIVTAQEAMPQEVEKKDEAASEKPAKPKKRAGRKPKAESAQKAEGSEKTVKKEKKEQLQETEKQVETKKPAEEIIKAEKLAEEIIKAEKPAEEIIKVEKPAEETRKAEKPAEEIIKAEKPVEEIIKAEKPAAEIRKAEEPAGGESTVIMDTVTSAAVPEKTVGGNNNERILELHRAGKSNMAIARELSLGVGEVKLVIDLFEGM